MKVKQILETLYNKNINVFLDLSSISPCDPFSEDSQAPTSIRLKFCSLSIFCR